MGDVKMKMNSDDVKNTLHQVDPYLMVSHVESVDSKYIKSVKIHSENEGHVHGHFPGTSIVPGAMIQEMCTQSAGILITKFYSPVENYCSKTTKGYALGVLNRVDFAKFLSVLRPSKPANIEVELIEHCENKFKFKARVSQEGHLCAKFLFTLVNIDDSYLFE